jgi:hypothetical protein
MRLVPTIDRPMRSAPFALALFVVIGCSDEQTGDERRAPPISVEGMPTRIGVSDSSSLSDTALASSPAAIVERYYDDIRAANYIAAYRRWSDDGRASRQTFDQFVSGFANTAEVTVTVREPVTIEGAAGSQYATVPVTVNAVTRDGKKQIFTGNYILRRAMVDGATPEQRRWRIYSAEIRTR